jgi:hypothetical protein
MIARDARAWLVLGGRLVLWTPGGYGDAASLRGGLVDVLTPRSTTKVLRAGYTPGLHPSAPRAVRG